MEVLSLVFTSLVYCHLQCISVHGVIDFSFNNCAKIITLKSQHSYITVVEYTNISFTQNSFARPIFIDVDDNNYKMNPLCLFQYTSF